jgi:peroxiredoxin Q/BCP
MGLLESLWRKPTMLNVGDQAPSFAVQDHTGAMRKLSDYRGKSVVLYFYPKADTPGCTVESCGFSDLYADFQNKNAEILGVSFDTVEENAAFAKKFGYKFPLLCDVKRGIGVAYGAANDAKAGYASRITYVIGPDGKIAQAHAKVSPKSHPKEILESL